jgi:hypothetical protein
MPLAGFEPTIPVFKRAKTFHALDRAATVTYTSYIMLSSDTDWLRTGKLQVINLRVGNCLVVKEQGKNQM